MPDEDLANLRLRDFMPVATVRRPLTHPLPHEPALIDAHNHLGRWLTDGWAAPDVAGVLAVMDEANVAAVVNLDGMLGDELSANLERYDEAHPGRFATFAQWDRSRFAEDDWAGLGAGIRDAAARGAKGLKVWKDLGLHLRDSNRALVMPDDPRLDPVWDACAAASIPVTIHTADPLAFFEPLDRTNERVEELLVNPDWWFGDRERFPRFDELLASLEGLIARRPDVTFLGAHVLGAAEDLGWVDRILTTYPNANADIAARIAELGRVPRAARDLLVRHPDRVLLGTDAFPPEPEVYAVHRRFLQTADEHFPYDPWDDEPPGQGRWAISGMDLPADVAAQVCAGNARRLIPGLA
jgi:predicted TIM-barrel fold metal-dependent hydrolase